MALLLVAAVAAAVETLSLILCPAKWVNPTRRPLFMVAAAVVGSQTQVSILLAGPQAFRLLLAALPLFREPMVEPGRFLQRVLVELALQVQAALVAVQMVARPLAALAARAALRERHLLPLAALLVKRSAETLTLPILPLAQE